jgi:hypothetical protein
VKIKLKGQFFFVNNDKKTMHEVATNSGSPTTFDVKLPKKSSTYTQVFAKKGTYVVTDLTTKKSMTLYVG